MHNSKGLAHPEVRSRPVVVATERLLNCSLAGDAIKDSTAWLQVQFLGRHHGLTPDRAALIAGMVWGGLCHG